MPFTLKMASDVRHLNFYNSAFCGSCIGPS